MFIIGMGRLIRPASHLYEATRKVLQTFNRYSSSATVHAVFDNFFSIIVAQSTCRLRN